MNLDKHGTCALDYVGQNETLGASTYQLRLYGKNVLRIDVENSGEYAIWVGHPASPMAGQPTGGRSHLTNRLTPDGVTTHVSTSAILSYVLPRILRLLAEVHGVDPA